MTPIPNAGKAVAEFEESLQATIDADPKPQHGGTRPGAGRKTKPPAAEINRIQTSEIGDAVVQFIKIPFDLWAAKAKISELALTDDEAQTAAKPTMILLEHYSPNLGEIAIAWASLGIVAAAIFRPRIMVLRKHNQSDRAAGAGGAGDPPAPAQAAPRSKTGYPTEKEIKPSAM